MDPRTRQKHLAAQKERRRSAREAEQRRRRRTWLAVGGGVAVAAVAAGAVFAAAPWEDDTVDATQAATVACNYLQPPVQGFATPARDVSPPAEEDVPASGSATATIQFADGPLTVALDRAAAPCAVNSFVSLTEQGFYDDTPCHRITTAPSLSVLQCGDPSGAGTGGPGYSFTTEPPATATNAYVRGVVAMANSGTPDSNGSQFFIVFADSSLPPEFTVFGTVTDGMAVVDGFAQAGTADGSSDGAPVQPVTIEKVTIS